MAAVRRGFGIGLAVAIASLAGLPAAAFDRAAWHADFDALRAGMATDYANFEWAAERGMDLPTLVTRTRSRLDAAGDDTAARAALERFVRSFGDGHLELRWPVAAGPVATPEAVCVNMGFEDGTDRGAIATRLPGFAAVTPPGAAVVAGIVPVNGKRLGVLRLPMFAPQGYPAACPAALAALGIAADAPCDARCGERVIEHADRAIFGEIAAAVRALATRQPDAILIDIAENGGGNDSAIAIARLFGEVATPRLAVLRGPRQAMDFAEDAARLRAASAGAGAEARALLAPLLARLDAAAVEAARPCDRSPLWRGDALGCTGLIDVPLYAGGLIPGTLPARFTGAPWAEQLTSSSRYGAIAPLWAGRLLVLIDGNSASSSELFAAMLRDAGRATIIGAPSFGAGCGHTRPRAPLELKHSGGRLEMPDCARRRANGGNEVAGIVPDRLIALRTYDTVRQRVAKLAAALPELVRAR